MRVIKRYWILVLIVLIASIVRFYNLSSIPPSINWDEAALGYNAYSILHTSRDEYGNILPLVFKSFGDYKPGMYVYLDAPFVLLFGLTEFAVRMPSAIFGILSVLVFYFLVKELFDQERLALIASFFLAISPWHLIISRPAFETNVALFFNLLGIFMFLRFLKRGNFYLILSLFSFIFSLYTYQSSKLIVPSIVFVLVILWWKELWKLKLKIIASLFVISLLAIPIYFGTIFGGQGGRLEVFSVFSYRRGIEELTQLAAVDKTNVNSLPFRIFHSEVYNFGQTILGHYLNHFAPRFLFFEGDYQNKRTGIQDSGMMYLFDAVFLILGAFIFFKTNLDRKKYFLLFWLIISPLPAALTRDLVAPLRAANMIPPLILFSALGAEFVLNKIKTFSKVIYFISALGFGIFIFWNVLSVFDSYFIHSPKSSSKDWVFGYKEAIKSVENKYDNYDKIVFTTAYNEPYIFTLFYNRYSPQEFQAKAKLEYVRGAKDVGEVINLDKYNFRQIYYPSDRDLNNTLIVGTSMELSEHDLNRDLKLGKIEIIDEIKFLDSETAFKIIGVK